MTTTNSKVKGAVLAKWWESAPDLWAWLWRVLGGWVEQDLTCWPPGLENLPEVPSGMVQRLAAEAESGEDVALLLAAVVVPKLPKQRIHRVADSLEEGKVGDFS